MKHAVALALVLFVLVGAIRPAFADGNTVWSGLILATNSGHPSEAPAEIAKFKTKLENVFGYNQFELIGQHTELMDNPNERWLIPSKDFFLHVVSTSKGRTAYTFTLHLFQQKRSLAQFEAKLEPESPLFIRGPLCGGGQLIIVLLVK